jgi:integrase
MSKDMKYTGVQARTTSILIDLRTCGFKQVTYAIPPTPRNLRYAANLRKEILAKHNRGTLVITDYFPDDAVKDCFNDFADKWLAIVSQELAETTVNEYATRLRKFRRIWGSISLDKITPDDVLMALATIKVKAKTFNGIICPLRALFSLAFKLKTTNVDLSEFVGYRRKEQDEDPDPYTTDEINRFLQAAGEWRNYFEVAFYTGLRPSEQIALRWEQIDLENRIVTIKRARVQNIAKPTASMKSRIVRLPNRAHEALIRQYALSHTSEYVFLDPIKGTLFSKTQQPCDALKRINSVAEVRARTARQTRHTYAVQMLLAGAKPDFIVRQLGTVSIELFFRTYSKWLTSADDWKEVDKLNATTGVTSK